MSRLRLLDRLAGEELMTRWHRDIGGALIVAVLGHMALILVGYGALDGFNPLVEAKVLITGVPDMLTAFLSAGILTAVGLFSIRAVRNADAVRAVALAAHVHLPGALPVLRAPVLAGPAAVQARHRAHRLARPRTSAWWSLPARTAG